jgi:exodeoxyribonuclease III
MAYRKKAGRIMLHKPDIVIVPECEHPDKLNFNSEIPVPTSIFWFGENKNKGLAVFSYGEYKFQPLDEHNPNFRMILPFNVSNGEFDFVLFAIWANNPQDPKFQYVGQIWKAIHYYEDLLKNEKIILAGDFNSSSIWDLPRREHNHSNVVNHLKQKGIYSAYHQFYNQKQGAEEHPTLFMYRHRDKPYHIDYCFASTHFIEKLQSVEIGNYEQWIKLSDHMPVIVSFDSLL